MGTSITPPDGTTTASPPATVNPLLWTPEETVIVAIQADNLARGVYAEVRQPWRSAPHIVELPLGREGAAVNIPTGMP